MRQSLDGQIGPSKLYAKTINELEQPDPLSRTPTCNGARIKRLDKHRDWGWLIVNYSDFRKIASEEHAERGLARELKIPQPHKPRVRSVTLL